VQGQFYEAGSIVTASSGPCLQCRCNLDEKLDCEPQDCETQPLVKRMLENLRWIVRLTDWYMYIYDICIPTCIYVWYVYDNSECSQPAIYMSLSAGHAVCQPAWVSEKYDLCPRPPKPSFSRIFIYSFWFLIKLQWNPLSRWTFT